jgi:hypothetical protein
MRRALAYAASILGCGVVAGACLLNPQPLPPEDHGSASNLEDAGAGATTGRPDSSTAGLDATAQGAGDASNDGALVYIDSGPSGEAGADVRGSVDGPPFGGDTGAGDAANFEDAPVDAPGDAGCESGHEADGSWDGAVSLDPTGEGGE